MLHYAGVSFVVDPTAARFGPGGTAVGAGGTAKMLFVSFGVLAVETLPFGLIRKG